ncbi:MAG: bifunctional hydroxymethylpyrimidine kinase/phosphomethylpyrimidine kinase [Marinilabiliaceae bacterium]|nr:bifunctional hydroxymethylpyrimidine kinase/phosphomethylpyrimidine kinase [Marinilabiliaceae bacterium]
MKHYTRILTIAGSDPSGGAGIQADIKTISALKCYAASAITALTIQNTKGVTAVEPVGAEVLEGQIRAVLDDIGADVIKIGMLCNTEQVRTVARLIREYGIQNVVLDPVLASTSGATFLIESARGVLLNELMPLCRIVTPNIPEMRALLGNNENVSTEEDMKRATRELSTLIGGKSVLLKGGHNSDSIKNGEVFDILFDSEVGEGTHTIYRTKHIKTKNTHGTGCTLSSAIASYMGTMHRASLASITAKAKRYISGAMGSATSYKIGGGKGPVDFFWDIWWR